MKKLIRLFAFFNFILSSSYSFSQAIFSDTTINIYPIIDKAEFDTLHGRDFVWILFESINTKLSYTPFNKREAFIENLSDEQKALFYVLELERAVRVGNLGFTNFYYNYKSYYSETVKALKLINDTNMLNVMYGVNEIYLKCQKQIDKKLNNGGWKYIERKFSFFDKLFFKTNEQMIVFLEKFIKQNPNKFLRLK